jgi:uncharacterized protein (TIGR02246 family)
VNRDPAATFEVFMRCTIATLSLACWCVSALPASAQVPTPDALVDSFLQAWNTHDPRVLDAALADDADWVTASTLRLSSREAIQSYLAHEHSTWARTTQMSAGTRTMRMPSADVAVVSFDWVITGGTDRQGNPAVFRGANMFVATRGLTGWRLIAGQVTSAR